MQTHTQKLTAMANDSPNSAAIHHPDLHCPQLTLGRLREAAGGPAGRGQGGGPRPVLPLRGLQPRHALPLLNLRHRQPPLHLDELGQGLQLVAGAGQVPASVGPGRSRLPPRPLEAALQQHAAPGGGRALQPLLVSDLAWTMYQAASQGVANIKKINIYCSKYKPAEVEPLHMSVIKPDQRTSEAGRGR